MKFLLSLLLCSTAFAFETMPLDINFNESQNWLKKIQDDKSLLSYEPLVKESIDGGEKMSQWLKLINSKRDASQVIRLTSKATQRGIPIEAPSIYSPETIAKQYTELNQDMPEYFKNIIYGTGEITDTLATSDEEFIKWARLTSRLYQTAVRWTGMKGFLPQLALRKMRDVRGYYYLKNLQDLDYTLENIDLFTQEEIAQTLQALEGICINTWGTDKDCDTQVTAARVNKTLKQFKDRYWKNAIRNWNIFFKIFNPRKDVVWSKKNPNQMLVTFKDPKNATIANWLKLNIEDEFQWNHWNLQMDFVKGGILKKPAYIEFKAGVTPHVTGGNKIVMDANTPLEEYGVKWTIRHEYGHILRLPDCYHEFYDTKRKVIINYQLDITDLMCSRVGQMNERIYNELKRVYYQ